MSFLSVILTIYLSLLSPNPIALISQRGSKDEHISDNTKLLELLLLKYILLFPGHRFSHSFLMIFILRTKHKFNKLNNAECIPVSSLSLLRKQQYCFLITCFDIDAFLQESWNFYLSRLFSPSCAFQIERDQASFPWVGFLLFLKSVNVQGLLSITE